MSRKQDRELVRRARADLGQLSSAVAQEVLERPDALEHLLAGRLWQEALPGVLVPAAIAVDREIRERAVHSWERVALLSHYSAARHEGFWVPEHPDAWAIVPMSSKRRSLEGLQVRRTKKWPETCRGRGLVEWTRADRTLVDLAGELSQRQLEAVLMSAVRHDKTSAAQVAELAATMRTRAGVSMLLELTGLWDPKRESLLEGKLFASVQAVSPFEVTRQHVVHGLEGEEARADVAVPELRLAFEGDGLFFHSTEAQIQSDQGRDRWMAAAGWPTHRYREGTLDDDLGVRRQVRAILVQRAQDLRIPFAA